MSPAARSILTRLFSALEAFFILSLFWQTRLNLSHIWPSTFSLPLTSDYLAPFFYLFQLLFIGLVLLWLTIYIPSISALKHRLSQIAVLIHSRPRYFFLISLISTSIITLISLSIITNGNNWWQWGILIRYILAAGIGLYMYIRLRQGQLVRLVWLCLISLSFQQLLIVYQWFHQGTLGLQWLGEWHANLYTPGVAKVIIQGQEYFRPPGTFAHPNVIGAILSITLIPGMLFIYYYSRRWTKLARYTLTLVWFTLGAIAIFLTFSRTAWLIAALSITTITLKYLYSYFFSSYRLSLSNNPLISLRFTSLSRLHKISIASALTITISATIILTPLITNRLTSLTSYDSLSLDRRTQLNNLALDHIKSSPWWGLGPGGFMLAIYQYGPLYGVGIWRQPVHNLPLLLAAEYGLPLTMLILAITLYSTYRIVIVAFSHLYKPSSSIPAQYLALSLIITLIGLLLTSAVDHYWLTVAPAATIVAIGIAFISYTYSYLHQPSSS